MIEIDAREEQMDNALKEPRKNKNNRNPAAEVVARAIIENYNPGTVEDIGYTACNTGHIWSYVRSNTPGRDGYYPGDKSNNHGYKDTENRRNGFKDNTSQVPFFYPVFQISVACHYKSLLKSVFSVSTLSFSSDLPMMIARPCQSS